ncbi:MAG: iron permease [Alphaproteobacteria bacterium]|nr:iron permease [Alphaproteobacteria bacterium]
MLGIAVIVFREVLEAALIVSVILAATRGVHNRLAMIGGGVAAGCIGSWIVAFFTAQLSNAFAGNGQELLHAGIMFTVVGLLAWHVIWMQSHGREMVHEMKDIGAAVVAGKKPLLALAIVVALAVLREGSEVVLFVQGMMASGAQQDVAVGFVLGLFTGVLIGAFLYAGFVKLSLKHLFSTTNIVLILIAAGMAARGSDKLIQAGFIPSLYDRVWDSSALLPETSVPGQLLSALVGYIAQPNAMQLVFYGVTVTCISALLYMQKKPAVVKV